VTILKIKALVSINSKKDIKRYAVFLLLINVILETKK